MRRHRYSVAHCGFVQAGGDNHRRCAPNSVNYLDHLPSFAQSPENMAYSWVDIFVVSVSFSDAALPIRGKDRLEALVKDSDVELSRWNPPRKHCVLSQDVEHYPCVSSLKE